MDPTSEEKPVNPAALAVPDGLKTAWEKHVFGPLDSNLDGFGMARELLAQRAKPAANLDLLTQIQVDSAAGRIQQYFAGVDDFLKQDCLIPADLKYKSQDLICIFLLLKEHLKRFHPISLLTVVIRESRRAAEPVDALAFLQSFLPVAEGLENAMILLKAAAAQHLLNAGLIEECERLLFGNLEGVVESAFGLPLVVEYTFHQSAAQYLYHVGDYSLFYHHAMIYLKSRDQGSATVAEDVVLANQACRAVLLSHTLYSFSELLNHPILAHVSPGGIAYPNESSLRDLLVICNSGDLTMFETFVAKRASQIEQVGLAPHLPFLTEKVRVFAFLEMAFMKPQPRKIAFAEISSICRVPIDGVEKFVIGVMAHSLIKGTMDQSEQVLTVTYVQPRLLDEQKIRSLAEKFATWSNQLSTVASQMKKIAPELLQKQSRPLV